MLAHRLRRWANISPALGQRLVFAGIVSVLVITLSLSTPSLHGIVNRQKWKTSSIKQYHLKWQTGKAISSIIIAQSSTLRVLPWWYPTLKFYTLLNVDLYKSKMQMLYLTDNVVRFLIINLYVNLNS